MSFDKERQQALVKRVGLNPFRAGRCLSTHEVFIMSIRSLLSQSLSSRAMSFDMFLYALLTPDY